MNTNFAVIAHYPNAKLTCETNDLSILFGYLHHNMRNDIPVDVLDTETGEVLFYWNPDDYYMADDFTLLALLWLMDG